MLYSLIRKTVLDWSQKSGSEAAETRVRADQAARLRVDRVFRDRGVDVEWGRQQPDVFRSRQMEV